MGFWWKPESRCAMPAWILARAEEVSRRSVLAALWYYLLLGDVEANFTRKFSFFSFFFFCFTACHDLSKSNSLFESFFLFFFLFVRYDRNWPRLESIFLFVLEERLFSNPRSFLLTFTIVKLPLPSPNKSSDYLWKN